MAHQDDVANFDLPPELLNELKRVVLVDCCVRAVNHFIRFLFFAVFETFLDHLHEENHREGHELKSRLFGAVLAERQNCNQQEVNIDRFPKLEQQT